MQKPGGQPGPETNPESRGECVPGAGDGGGFRDYWLDRALPPIRGLLALALGLVLVVSVVERLSLSGATAPGNTTGRLMVMLALGLALVAAICRPLHPWLPAVLGGALGAIGIGAVLPSVATPGAGLLPAGALLVTLVTYLIPGLPNADKLLVGSAILLGYIGIAVAGDVGAVPLVYGVTALAAANVAGGYSGRWLQSEVRALYEKTLELSSLVNVDELTGIYSRRAFDDHIRRLWGQSRRHRANLSLLFINVDFLTAFNARYGVKEGDKCIRRVAAELAKCSRRPLDFIARYEGDTFALVLYDPPTSYIRRLVLNIQSSIAELHIPNEDSSIGPRLTVSVGAVVLGPDTSRSIEGAILFAEEALHQARSRGRNRAIVFESSDLQRRGEQDAEIAVAVGDG